MNAVETVGRLVPTPRQFELSPLVQTTLAVLSELGCDHHPFEVVEPHRLIGGSGERLEHFRHLRHRGTDELTATLTGEGWQLPLGRTSSLSGAQLRA